MRFDYEGCVDIIVTCRLGMERVVASYIAELDPNAKAVPAPDNFMGLVIVYGVRDKSVFAEEIRRRVPEAEKIYTVLTCSKADVNSIVDAVKSVVKNLISPSDSFAVRTTRRGTHSFTSIDVNVAVGATVKEMTNARVDLENPDKVIVIQIIKDYAYISIVPGNEFYKKMKPYKYPMYKIFNKLVVAHEPYLGPADAAYTFGTRIGREVQTYEVGELVVAPIGPVDAYSLYNFLRGLFEGIESRYEIQRKSYGREVVKTKVMVQDMYQFVRSRIGEPLIIFEPEGEPISRVSNEVAEFVMSSLKKGKRINIMIGAREGVPTSLFRYANFVLDVAPGIVISTEYALSSALIALTTILHEKLVEEKEQIA
ncbi:MAG: SPOUT family RNA methylase [Ignisphaera sp.]